MDVVDKETRSRMMAGIRSKNTKPELRVRRFLHKRGFRYRIHDTKLLGRPDIVFSKYQVVIFVHGCFWHRHPMCRLATTPANREKWLPKLEGNVQRDKKHISALIDDGWHVIVIWECGVKGKSYETKLEWLIDAIKHPSEFLVQWPILS